MAHTRVESVRLALAQVAGDASALDVFGSDAAVPPHLPGVGQRRRATRRGAPDPVQRASLYLDADGVLEWQLEAAHELGSPGLRRGARRSLADLDPEPPDGELVDVFEFEALEVNAVGAFLQRVDERLNPRLHQQPGRLWRLSPGAAGQVQPQATVLGAPPGGKLRRLLFVHGTFSQSQAFFDGIAAAANGAAFMGRLFQAYDEVLAFEHPTLSVSPLMNALDLQRELSAIQGPLDIVAHSRGGLVVRWALEALGLPAQPVRVVLVGSPLGGTSLASPPRLKSTLGLLANFGHAVMAAGGLVSASAPLLLVPLALVKVASSIATAAAHTPLLDGAINLVPGLAAQSRVANNPELGRLRRLPRRPQIDYHVVTSNFEPEDPGWKFWQRFRGKRLAHAAADKVFPGANDLVVDTESMSELPAALAGARHFGRNARVHHTNYFEQPQTLKFIIDSLGWP